MDADRTHPAARSAGTAAEPAPTSRTPAVRRRAWLYAAAVVLALVGGFAVKQRTDGVFACPPASGDRYLAYCHASAFGDYDHGAFWFGFEPRAEAAARSADVLFLGSSRMQFAFSTEAVARHFGAMQRSHYLLGFSHTGNVGFVAPLLERLKPRARAYVINVDRFFDDRPTAPAKAIQGDRDARASYREKRFWQWLQRPLCSALGALCGTQLSFVRERSTGAWRLDGRAPFEAGDIADGPPADRDQWERYAQLARQFVAALPVERRCVLLTIAPYDATRIDEARAIAAALSLPLIAPRVDGLRTFDSSHLDRTSAERWSSAFLAEADATLRACVADTAR